VASTKSNSWHPSFGLSEPTVLVQVEDGTNSILGFRRSTSRGRVHNKISKRYLLPCWNIWLAPRSFVFRFLSSAHAQATNCLYSRCVLRPPAVLAFCGAIALASLFLDLQAFVATSGAGDACVGSGQIFFVDDVENIRSVEKTEVEEGSAEAGGSDEDRIALGESTVRKMTMQMRMTMARQKRGTVQKVRRIRSAMTLSLPLPS